jgi:hypothetical protein
MGVGLSGTSTFCYDVNPLPMNCCLVIGGVFEGELNPLSEMFSCLNDVYFVTFDPLPVKKLCWRL